MVQKLLQTFDNIPYPVCQYEQYQQAGQQPVFLQKLLGLSERAEKGVAPAHQIRQAPEWYGHQDCSSKIAQRVGPQRFCKPSIHKQDQRPRRTAGGTWDTGDPVDRADLGGYGPGCTEVQPGKQAERCRRQGPNKHVQAFAGQHGSLVRCSSSVTDDLLDFFVVHLPGAAHDQEVVHDGPDAQAAACQQFGDT